MITILLLSVLGAVLGAVLAAGIGTFWYSTATPMGRIHMQYLGFDKLSKKEQDKKIEEAKPRMGKVYGAQMALSFLTAFAVVFIVITSMRNELSFGMALAFVVLNWLCFMVPVTGSGILWGTCDPKIAWQKFFSDIFSNLVTVLVIAVLASFFV